MSANGQLVFTDVDKVTFKGVGNASNAVIDTTTGKIGVGVDSPDANLHVVGNCFVSTNFELGGTMTMGTVTVEAQHELSAITATGNVTPHTIQFTNPTTAFTTTGNVSVGKELSVTGNVAVDTDTLFVDSVNDRVGVGKTDPATALDVVGTVTATAFAGNATTASALAASVNIGGVAFDGSADITPTTFTAATFSGDVTVDSTTFHVDTTENRVGIGTTSPGSKLNMKSGVFLAENQASTNGKVLYYDAGGSGGSNNNQYTIGNAKLGVAQFVNDTGTTGSTITLVNKELTNNTTKHASIGFVNTDTAGDGKFGGQIGFWPEDVNALKQQFRIYTSGASSGYNLPVQRMVVDGDGNVGIGTTSPGGKLEIGHYGSEIGDLTALRMTNFATNLHGSVLTEYNLVVSDINAATGLGNGKFSIAHRPTKSNSLSHRLVIDNSGNVGIGTTTPAIQLDVHGTDAKIGRALYSANIHAAEKRDSVYIGRWDDTTLSTSFLGMRCRVDTHTALGYGSYSSQTEIGFYAWGNSIANSRQVFAINAYGNGNMIGTLTQSSTGTTSDDRIKYNEEDITSPLTLISQLNPQKYEKIVSVAVSEKEGIWIPTDEEWESVKSEYTYVDEFGFIAQDVRAVPELSFLVNGEETRTDTNTLTPEEYSNLTSEEQVTYTPSYVYESNTITQQEYSNLAHEEQGVCTTQYIKQIETQTPLSLNYNGLFVLAIGAIKELKAENDAIKARLDALENA